PGRQTTLHPLVSLRLLFRRSFRGADRFAPLIALLVLATTAMLVGYLLGRRRLPTVPAGRLEVAVLNVQQGEASWVRTPNGKFILIGAGPVDQGGRIVASLREAGARRID